MGAYEEFLKSKELKAIDAGFDLDRNSINKNAFEFQKDIIQWACKKGRAAILTGCGSGKTMMQLEWARAVHNHTGRKVLILAPLSVVNQTVEEARKFGIGGWFPVGNRRTQREKLMLQTMKWLNISTQASFLV